MKRLLLLIILLCLPLATVLAANVASLYQAEIPVASQTEDLREQAIRDGFLQMLVKLSGDPRIDQNRTIKESLAKADYYVQEYSYSSATMTSSEYMLRIHYEKQDVNKLLKKAGVAYWGETRPLILVWLVVTDSKNNSDIIGSEVPGDTYSLMKTAGKKFGLPVIFPLMDVDDVNQVSVDNILEMALPELTAAAKRYSPDALLIGKMQESPDGIESDWQLVLDGGNWTWSIKSKTSEEVVTEIMNDVSQTLAKHYIVKTSDASSVWIKLEVSNVAQRDDLNQLMQYLKQLTPVQQIKLSQVTGETVELALLVHGPIGAFQQNAAIGQRLILKSQDDDNGLLIYEWVP